MLRWLVCLVVVVCIWLFGVVVVVRFASCLMFGGCYGLVCLWVL